MKVQACSNIVCARDERTRRGRAGQGDAGERLAGAISDTLKYYTAGTLSETVSVRIPESDSESYIRDRIH